MANPCEPVFHVLRWNHEASVYADGKQQNLEEESAMISQCLHIVVPGSMHNSLLFCFEAWIMSMT